MLLAPAGIMAQDAEKQVVVVTADTRKAPLIRSVAFGVDLVGAALNTFSTEGDCQAFVQANLRGSILPVIEVGYGSSDKMTSDEKYKYKSSGMFGRIGVDYNMLNDKSGDYKLMIGARYGFCGFTSTTTPTPESAANGLTAFEDKPGMQWIELCAGVDAKVWGPLHMGWSIRYRHRMAGDEFIEQHIYAPGYGNAFNDVNIMALYTIGLQF